MLSIVEKILNPLLSALLLIGLFAGTAVRPADAAEETGTIVAGSLNVRQGPDRHQRIIKILKKGDVVSVLARQNGWLKIYHQGQVGYIRDRKRYVHTVPVVESYSKTPSEINDIREEAKTLDQQIQAREAEIRHFSEEEATILNGLNEMELAVNKAQQKVSTLQKERDAIEDRIRKTDTDLRQLLDDIQTTEKLLSQRLVALYKLNLLGRIHILASANSMYDFIYRRFALERILDHDDKLLKTFMKDKEDLVLISKDLREQKKKKSTVEARLREQIRLLSLKRRKRTQLLEEIQNKKSLGLAALDSLRQAAKALDQTILSLHVEPKKQPPEPLKGFEEYKGLLNLPVRGKIVAHFGPYRNREFNVTNFRSGIEIKADRGEPIHAVQSGIVLFAGWFKNYGNMIIIDHGDHYYTVYAHAQEIFKEKGQYVDADEVIATVGDTASFAGTRLYFEVRHHGKPLDPLNWLKKS